MIAQDAFTRENDQSIRNYEFICDLSIDSTSQRLIPFFIIFFPLFSIYSLKFLINLAFSS